MATNNAVNVGLSGSTGTGSFVGSTSPTLVTPVLGTPSSGTLSSCTGYTIANLADTAWTSFSGTIGFTGFSVNPSGVTARYKLIGKTCHVSINMTAGTSNATSFTITNLPATSGAADQFVAIAEAYNNGSIVGSPASGYIAASGTTLTMRLGGSSTGWTNANAKGTNCTFFYETA